MKKEKISAIIHISGGRGSYNHEPRGTAHASIKEASIIDGGKSLKVTFTIQVEGEPPHSISGRPQRDIELSDTMELQPDSAYLKRFLLALGYDLSDEQEILPSQLVGKSGIVHLREGAKVTDLPRVYGWYVLLR